MAKEAEDVENEENAEGAEAVKQPMFSKAGLIVFLVTVVLMLAVFAFLLLQVRKPAEEPEPIQEVKPVMGLMDLNAPRIKLDKPIIVSIPTNELATEFRHLAITLTILIGRLDDEYSSDFDLMKTLTQEQFLETAEKFRPFVEDRVNKIALSYTYLQLQEQSTRVAFTQQLKDDLNDILGTYGVAPRIKQVLINSFIFSD